MIPFEICFRSPLTFCSSKVFSCTKCLLSHTLNLSATRFSILFTNVYLFGILRRFQHCTGRITTGSWKGRGNQYIQFARVLYCKLPTNGKQLPAFPLKAVTGIESRPQRWEARVLPLCHRGPLFTTVGFKLGDGGEKS